MRFLFFATIATLCLPPAAYPQERAADIISDVHVLGPADTMQVDATMTTREGSSESERRLEGWYRRDNRDLSLFVQIVEPPFLRDMKLLLLRRGSREDTWMRTSRGVRRLGASGGQERVFGSHFTVSDITAVDPTEQSVRVVESSPDEIIIDVEDAEGDGYRRFSIQPEDRIIRGIQFFDDSGELVKEYTLLSLGSVDGRPVPMHGQMRLANGDHTVISVNNIEFPRSIPGRYFNRGNL